jgi:predicted phosphodiesterase
MRFLVISDIHANATALTAALAVAEGRWERAICLGDVVGYGPDPNEVIDRVRGLVAAIIRGNHDKTASGLGDLEDLNTLDRARVESTPERQRPENLL